MKRWDELYIAFIGAWEGFCRLAEECIVGVS